MSTEPALPKARRRTLRRIADNAISLFALQGLTYLISFITFPYLIRTLGTGQFGAVAFANTVTAQLILLTDFGFGSSATRLVAIHADDSKQINSIFSAVMAVKLLLMLLSAAVVLVLTLCFKRFHAEAVLFAISFLQVFGSVLFPSWLLQGLERMRFIAVTSIIARLCSTGLIFIFVHGPSDAPRAIACQSFGVLLQGFIALWFAARVLKIKIRIPTVAAMWAQLKDSFHPFLGASMGNLIGGSSVLFLGIFKDLTTVGAYAAIERTARAEVLALLPASQAAYPHMSQRFSHGLASGNRAMLKLCLYLLSAAAVFLGAISFFARPILHLLYGNKLMGQTHLFSTFSIWAFLSLLNTLLGLHYLIASGHSKPYGKSIFWSALVTVGLFLAGIPRFGGWGALLAVITGEVVQTALMLASIYKINRDHNAAAPAQPQMETA